MVTPGSRMATQASAMGWPLAAATTLPSTVTNSPPVSPPSPPSPPSRIVPPAMNSSST
jgi:hypothetical protein